ncbi:MAG: hypothetical protein VYB54_15745 [Pseudomonadota bacterium]|nr:hypothetical protein [Pseudomonadota bacterium]
MSLFSEILQVATPIAAALIQSNSASKAASAANKATQQQIAAAGDTTDKVLDFQKQQAAEATTLFKEARDRGLSVLDAGSLAALDRLGVGADRAQQIYRDVLDLSSQGITSLRQIGASRPEDLTPGQQLVLDDTLKDTQAALDRSALRGAGRAQVAVMDDIAKRYRASAYDTNQARIDDANRRLASQGFGALDKIAAQESALGGDTSNIINQTATNKANLERGFGTDSGAVARDTANVGTTAIQRGGTSVLDSLGDIGTNNSGKATTQGNAVASGLGSSLAVLDRIFSDDDTKARASRFAGG